METLKSAFNVIQTSQFSELRTLAYERDPTVIQRHQWDSLILTFITSFLNMPHSPASPLIVHIVTRSDTYGGVHAHIVDLVNNPHLNGFRHCVWFGSSSEMLLADRLKSFGIPFRVIKSLRPEISVFSDLLAVIHTSLFILKYRPSLVHIHSSKAGIIGRLSCFLMRSPCIFTVHGWSFNSTNKQLLLSHTSYLNLFYHMFLVRLFVFPTLIIFKE